MYNVGVEPTSPALRQVFLPKLKLFYTSVPSERFELSLLAEPGFESSVSTIPPQGHNLKNMANRNRTYFSTARKCWSPWLFGNRTHPARDHILQNCSTFFKVKCVWEDSNLHILANARTLTWCVYQFRHTRKWTKKGKPFTSHPREFFTNPPTD